MGILRIAFTTGLILSLLFTLWIVANLVAEVLRDGRRSAPTVLDIAPADPGQSAPGDIRRAA